METPQANERIVDRTLEGLRCRAAHTITVPNGSVAAATEGTILYELVKQESGLLSIDWDNGVNSLVPSSKIVLTDPILRWH